MSGSYMGQPRHDGLSEQGHHIGLYIYIKPAMQAGERAGAASQQLPGLCWRW